MSPRREPAQLVGTLSATILVLAFSAWQAAAAPGLGRLFSTPDERAHLDAIRRAHEYGAAVRTQAARAGARAEAPIVNQLTIEGVVLRGGGRGSVWINGEPVSANGGLTREGMIVEARPEAGGRVEIILPNGAGVQLDPGQKLNVASGSVFEPYQIEAVVGAAIDFEHGGPAVTSFAGEVVAARREASRDAITKPLEAVEGDLPGGPN